VPDLNTHRGLAVRNRPLERYEGVPMTFTWLGTAALHEVDDVFLRPGVSQFPAEEVADLAATISD
jgi:hypothetical protein